MEQIIVGVFESRSEAQRAKRALTDAGFADSQIDMHAEDSSSARTTDVADRTDAKEEGGIAHFFRSLFGGGDEHRDSADLYGEAVRRGHCVVTVSANDDELGERAQQIMEQSGAIDVDERSAGWNADSGTAATGTSAGLTGTSRSGAASSMNQDMSGMTQGMSSGMNQGASSGQKTTIPVVEEELRVGKRQVSRGGVRVFARRSDRPAEETVQLRKERATVERRPANRPATEADLAAFKEGAIEVRETVEEAVVDKRARVVEEVIVGKETTMREETVRDSVRHTDVEVNRLEADNSDRMDDADRTSVSSRDSLSDADDADYRAHWKSRYGDSGGRYEDYAPAYGYGSELRSSGRYEGRNWDEIEPEARRDWESRYPDNTWERFKDSIRHGWEKVTGSDGARSRGMDRTGRRPTA